MEIIITVCATVIWDIDFLPEILSNIVPTDISMRDLQTKPILCPPY